MPQFRERDHLAVKINRASSDQESMWDDFQFGPGILDKWVYFTDHFLKYNAGDWTVTETQAAATQALIDAHGGILRLTQVGDTENAVIGLQLGSEHVAPAAGKIVMFETRIRSSEATQVDWLVGLTDTDIALPATPSDGIYFRKDDGDTNIDVGCSSGSAESVELGVATEVAATFKTLGFKVTGTNLCEFWIDGVKKSTLTTNIPTGELRLSFAHADGAGSSADTFDVDYVAMAFEI